MNSTLSIRTHKLNWALILGIVIVGLAILTGSIGPDLAPQDPMEEHFTLRVDGKIRTPPYPAFTIPGYPLGTDNAGRDLLSRILWAIRPTLNLVTLVATIRLSVGVFIGLITGWKHGLFNQALDSLVTAALSIPVLIIAIISITAIGLDKGLFAFVIGLCLTGWAETARTVTLQTRLFRSQTYVEAARALGASDAWILIMHILRQVISMIWMLLAFEIGATLLVVAELGFLGYFIGGGAWVEILDFVAINVQGLPELGQMLSLSLVKLTDPSALLVVSGIVFLIVLGFNLIGEGLRANIVNQKYRSAKWRRVFGKQLGDWLEFKLIPGSLEWFINHIGKIGVGISVLIVVSGFAFGLVRWIDALATANNDIQETAGGPLWASEEQNPQGTRWAPFPGPSSPKLIWFYYAGGELVGSPVISEDGTIYLASKNRRLTALSPQGEVLWNTDLDYRPVGSLALGIHGEIYYADEEGGLSALALDGGKLWRFIEVPKRQATSGPVASSIGEIYYMKLDVVQALDIFGKPLWAAPYLNTFIENPPVLSPQESFIYIKSIALASDSGARIVLDAIPVDELMFTDPTFFAGADGQNYFRSGGQVYKWRSTAGGIEMDQPIGWDYNHFNSPVFPTQQGVTPQGTVWLFYGSDWMESRLVSISANGRMLSNVRYPENQGQLFGIDINSIAYFCSENNGLSAKCHAIQLGNDQSIWDLELGDNVIIAGGALAPGKLLISLKSGYLVALGNP